MKDKMFCFQCEQTADCTGCTGSAGVCGKSAATANLQDALTGELIGLAEACGRCPKTERTDRLLLESLFATLTNVQFHDDRIRALTAQVRQEKARLLSGGENNAAPHVCAAYDMQRLWEAPEDLRSLKSLLLFGLRGMAAYAYHAMSLGYADEEVNASFYKFLRVLTQERTWEELLPLALELGKVNLACMELLDLAHTETFGTPVPTTVSLTVEPGPCIVVSGHDLHDLQRLLEQTEGKGVAIYTHGEMLPAHAYPALKKHAHLKGHFGTAWQNQQKEFAQLPAPILFTTNCLMPPKTSYADRVFTTGVVSYPETAHIGPEKDFAPLIAKALALGGFSETMHFTGSNGGRSMTTGFGHGAVLDAAAQIVEAVKSGAIRHFFLVGGCDGARPGRNYFSEFVRQTPADTVVLTLACGKFRFNDLALGTVAGLPRLLDMGQCNDAYGAIKVATALANAFNCGVNALPLSMILSWYEQKAVCILLTLLHLGIQNIRLGPTLPAFLSPNVLRFLVETYNIAPIRTPEEDLQEILGSR